MTTPTAPEHTLDLSAAESLNFDQPVPRAFVHKTGPGEAFVTDFAQVAEDRFLVAAELPRTHAFYGDTTGGTPGVDPMTFLEIGRQSGYIVLHQHFGIPLANTFVMRSMGADIAAGAEALVHDGPCQVVFTLHLEKPFYRDGELIGFLGGGDVVTTGGVVLGSVMASFSWISHAMFKQFRTLTREQLGLPADPPPAAWLDAPKPTEAFGRQSVRNAMLAEPMHQGDTTTAFLRPDLNYVSVFDHAYDHVPGMAQTEGCKQLAVLGAAHRMGVHPDEVSPQHLLAKFSSINEVDFETVCTATFAPDEATGGLRAHVVAEQNGRNLGSVDVVVTRRSAVEGP